MAVEKMAAHHKGSGRKNAGGLSQIYRTRHEFPPVELTSNQKAIGYLHNIGAAIAPLSTSGHTGYCNTKFKRSY